MKLHIQDLGTVPYADAFDTQLRLHRDRLNKRIPDTLLLLEHPHVYTLGRHADDSHLVWDEAQRQERGIEVRRVDRGGDVTYHGPGQLVGYPIIELAARGLQPKRLVEWVEGLIIRTIAGFGISAYVHPDYPGVWVNDAKICAIGMRVRDGVSYHGFALNVSTDLSFFDGIVACGIKNKHVCSLESVLGRKIDIGKVKDMLIKEALSTEHLKNN